ncbi:hypothetical protein, variant 3 [Aphanomyces astaci]|uniref:Nudix hydrolase domain-containing protein n=1 Tax=Aphanomyces astaci TaxID=112090 RepID=W4HDP7_APHAT|nr:hypothetical protein, variant 3 [Aphanomyces astaci]ETV89263.1 hypothetical protein, variant 3 [Aphanomyces astaci]|eukprot:XP_009821663.1 hypothetical protein, variant 3 [Aphanomyces astaci]
MTTVPGDVGLLEAKLHGASAGEQKIFNLPHRATYVVVRNSAGLYYVQRRSSTKDYCPGLLEPMAGGVVGFGESYDESAYRELDEEMGIRNTPLTHITTFSYSVHTHHPETCTTNWRLIGMYYIRTSSRHPCSFGEACTIACTMDR